MRGALKLLYQGYEYTKQRTTDVDTFWMCVRQNKLGCKGRSITRQFGQKYYVKEYHNHNHLPNDIKSEF